VIPLFQLKSRDVSRGVLANVSGGSALSPIKPPLLTTRVVNVGNGSSKPAGRAVNPRLNPMFRNRRLGSPSNAPLAKELIPCSKHC
jgi:hypothetical protein